MVGLGGPALPGEPVHLSRLREASDQVVLRTAELAADPGDSRVELLVGFPALVEALREIEPTARESSRVLQPQYAYDPEDPGVALTRAARERGVVTELVTLPATVRTHPLLSSIFPQTLLGPVFLRAMVVDGRHAIVGGPHDVEGNRTSWYTDHPEVVSAVEKIWHETVEYSHPILAPGETPPLTERQLEVARLLCTGEKDAAIARTLELSSRTVEREVSVILRVLGASSRAEAVLLMRGRGVNGG